MNNLISLINQNSQFIVIGLLIVTVLLFIVVLILLSTVNKLEKKYKKLMKGTTNKNLEELINNKLDDISNAKERAELAINKCEILENDIKDCVNKVAIMRYKAFEDVGSDLSFSIAILDSYNDGIILTGIYARNDSTVYAKPIDKGISRYDLSEEEKHVLNEAVNKK